MSRVVLFFCLLALAVSPPKTAMEALVKKVLNKAKPGARQVAEQAGVRQVAEQLLPGSDTDGEPVPRPEDGETPETPRPQPKDGTELNLEGVKLLPPIMDCTTETHAHCRCAPTADRKASCCNAGQCQAPSENAVQQLAEYLQGAIEDDQIEELDGDDPICSVDSTEILKRDDLQKMKYYTKCGMTVGVKLDDSWVQQMIWQQYRYDPKKDKLTHLNNNRQAPSTTRPSGYPEGLERVIPEGTAASKEKVAFLQVHKGVSPWLVIDIADHILGLGFKIADEMKRIDAERKNRDIVLAEFGETQALFNVVKKIFKSGPMNVADFLVLTKLTAKINAVVTWLDKEYHKGMAAAGVVLDTALAFLPMDKTLRGIYGLLKDSPEPMDAGAACLTISSTRHELIAMINRMMKDYRFLKQTTKGKYTDYKVGSIVQLQASSSYGQHLGYIVEVTDTHFNVQATPDYSMMRKVKKDPDNNPAEMVICAFKGINMEEQLLVESWLTKYHARIVRLNWQFFAAYAHTTNMIHLGYHRFYMYYTSARAHCHRAMGTIFAFGAADPHFCCTSGQGNTVMDDVDYANNEVSCSAFGGSCSFFVVLGSPTNCHCRHLNEDLAADGVVGKCQWFTNDNFNEVKDGGNEVPKVFMGGGAIPLEGVESEFEVAGPKRRE